METQPRKPAEDVGTFPLSRNECGELVAKYPEGSTARMGKDKNEVMLPGSDKWLRVEEPPTVAVAAPTTGTTVPPAPRQSARAPRSRRATTRTRSRSPGRSTSADEGDDPDPERAELVAALAAYNLLADDALNRDDVQAAIDAASAGFAESFAFAWLHADLDRLCPRCSNPWTVHSRSGQRFCDFCFLKNVLALGGRVA